MSSTSRSRRPFKVRHQRYLAFLIASLLCGLGFTTVLKPTHAVLAGFDAGAIFFVVSLASLWRDGGPDVIRHIARRDDGGEHLILAVTALIVLVIIGTIALLLTNKGYEPGSDIGLVMVTLVSAWLFQNLVFALHYARLCYTGSSESHFGGLSVPGTPHPDFSDFVNFSLVIGMTCQTADIEITSRAIRRVSTFHGFLAFVFNLGVLALCINVLAGVGG